MILSGLWRVVCKDLQQACCFHMLIDGRWIGEEGFAGPRGAFAETS
jgi:hypothetical protein